MFKRKICIIQKQNLGERCSDKRKNGEKVGISGLYSINIFRGVNFVATIINIRDSICAPFAPGVIQVFMAQTAQDVGGGCHRISVQYAQYATHNSGKPA